MLLDLWTFGLYSFAFCEEFPAMFFPTKLPFSLEKPNKKLTFFFVFVSTSSAAQCIHNKASTRLTPDQISITLGTIDFSNNNGVIVDVINVTIHPEWNTTYNTKYDADIAIIELKQTVEFSETIQPACLPQRDEKVFEVTGFVAGYGTYSNEDTIDGMLRYVKIPTVSQEECLWHPSGFANVASKRTFCGGDLNKSACK